MKDRMLFAANNQAYGLAALLLAGLLLRLAALNGSLWYDESFSAWLAGLPFNQMMQATLSDVHPPLYYGILWAAVRLLWPAEWVFRLPSIVGGLLLVPAVWRLCGRLGMSVYARFGSVALVALLPFQIYYSTEARSYALQMFAVTVAALGLVEKRGWLLVLGSLAALYLQHTAALAVGALFVAAWFVLDTRRWLYYAGGVALGFLPGMVVLMHQFMQVSAGYWILPLDHPGRVANTLDNLLWWMPYSPLPITGLVTGLGVVLIVADGRRLWFNQRLALIMAAVPLGAAVLVSLIWQPILMARILAPSAPFSYMLVADVTTRNRARACWWAVAAAFIMVIDMAMVAGSAGRPPATTLYAIDGLRASDGIYHTSAGSYVPWHYYQPNNDQWLFAQHGSLSHNVSDGSKVAMGFNQADLAAVACQHPRWWIITFDNPTSTPTELNYSSFLAQNATLEKVFRSDSLVESRLYQFRPKNCYSGL